jgi:hypothetical protein
MVVAYCEVLSLHLYEVNKITKVMSVKMAALLVDIETCFFFSYEAHCSSGMYRMLIRISRTYRIFVENLWIILK